jgi:beta-lactamase superfamily II metal-dependent hydrolase
MGITVDDFPGSRVYVLAPEDDIPADNVNNSSVVFMLVHGAVSILFTGDAELESESRLVRRYGGFLRANLLKVGHHGSSTSSTPGFRSAVSPDIAVISVGVKNRYRHPSPDVLAGYLEQRTQVLRTDEDGAIVFETDGSDLERIFWNDD